MIRLHPALLCAFFVLMMVGPLRAQTPAYVSEYTAIDKKSCKLLQAPGVPGEDGPNDDFHQKCPGRDGYSVDELGGDARTWLVLSKGQDKINLYGLGAEDLVFPVVQGGKLEWRYRSVNGQKQLGAIIFRMSGYEPKAYEAGDYKTLVSMLYAIRIAPQGFCILGKAKTNEEARRLSDGGANCELKPFEK